MSRNQRIVFTGLGALALLIAGVAAFCVLRPKRLEQRDAGYLPHAGEEAEDVATPPAMPLRKAGEGGDASSLIPLLETKESAILTAVSTRSGHQVSFLTFALKESDKLTVWKLGEHDKIVRLGEHRVNPTRPERLVPGAGAYYALADSGMNGDQCRVFSGEREEYRIPERLQLYMGKIMTVQCILANGNALVNYDSREMLEGGRPDTFAAIISPRGEYVLAPGPEEAAWHVVSGNGLRVAITFAPPQRDQKAPRTTKVFSAADGRLESVLNGFHASGISHDGSVLVGTDGDRIVAFRQGRRVAEKPLGTTLASVISLASDGSHVVTCDNWSRLSVLETRGLRTVYEVPADSGFHFATWAVSPSGELAAVHDRAVPSRNPGVSQWHARLTLHGSNGALSLQRAFDSTATYPGLIAWTLDGRGLVLVQKEQVALLRSPR